MLCNHSVANIFNSPLNLHYILAYIHVFYFQWLYAFIVAFLPVIFELLFLETFIIYTWSCEMNSSNVPQVVVLYYHFHYGKLQLYHYLVPYIGQSFLYFHLYRFCFGVNLFECPPAFSRHQ